METIKSSKETYALMDIVLGLINKNISVLVVGGESREAYHTIQSVLKHKSINFDKINLGLTQITPALRSVNKDKITLIEGFFNPKNHGHGIFKSMNMSLLKEALSNTEVSRIMFCSKDQLNKFFDAADLNSMSIVNRLMVVEF